MLITILKFALTETSIILHLADWLDIRRFPFQMPRSFVYKWESDYWAMDATGVTREYEIMSTVKSETREHKEQLYKLFAMVGNALANPHRLEIIDLLAQSPRTVEELACLAQMSLANTSQH